MLFLKKRLMETPEVSPVLQKMRTTPWTWDDICAAGQKVPEAAPCTDAGGEHAPPAPAGEGGGDTDCGSIASGSLAASFAGPIGDVAKTVVGPSLNRTAAVQSVSVVCRGNLRERSDAALR